MNQPRKCHPSEEEKRAGLQSIAQHYDVTNLMQLIIVINNFFSGFLPFLDISTMAAICTVMVSLLSFKVYLSALRL